MSNIVKLAPGVVVKDFTVAKKWIHAKLEIDIKRFRYFGRWICEGVKSWKFGNEEDDKIIVPIQKQMQKWDSDFWLRIKEAVDNNETIPEEEFKKLLRAVGKRPKEFAEAKQNKKVTDSILSRSW